MHKTIHDDSGWPHATPKMPVENKSKTSILLPITKTLAGLGHSRTLYTSNALDQSNFII